MNGSTFTHIAHTVGEMHPWKESGGCAGRSAPPPRSRRRFREKPTCRQTPPFPTRGASAFVALAIALISLALACGLASPAASKAYADASVYTGSIEVGQEFELTEVEGISQAPDGTLAWCAECLNMTGLAGSPVRVYELVGTTFHPGTSYVTKVNWTVTQWDVTALAAIKELLYDKYPETTAYEMFQRYIWDFSLANADTNSHHLLARGEGGRLSSNYPDVDWSSIRDEALAMIADGKVVGRGFAYLKDDGGQAGLSLWLEPAYGNVELVKSSANESITDGNACYNLAGAEYTVYSDSACTSAVTALSTDESGYAKSGDIVAGAYYVKETKAATGYALDETVYPVTVKAGETVSVNGSAGVEDVPQSNPAALMLAKVDAETGKAMPLGNASLAKAQFTVNYYASLDDDAISDANLKATWVFETDANGSVDLSNSDECLVSVSGHGLYENSEGSYALPLGTYTIQETKAPVGYLVDDEIYTRTVTGEGSLEEVRTYNAPAEDSAIAEQVKRGDFQFTKQGDDDRKRLANIPFLITSKTTGEAHIVVTDANGQFSSHASYNAHTVNTNAYDAAYDAETGTIDEEALSQIIEETGGEVGTWFGQNAAGDTASADDSLCALPYDDYTIDELACTANSSLLLYTGQSLTISKDSHTVDLGTLEDPQPTISTIATDAADGDKTIAVSAESTIRDTVSYSGMTSGTEGTLEAQVVNKATGEVLAETTSEFTADVSGKAYVDIDLDTSELAGCTLSVIERLYVDGELKAEHNVDLNEADQDVEVADADTDETPTPTSYSPSGSSYAKTGAEILPIALGAASALIAAGATGTAHLRRRAALRMRCREILGGTRGQR